MLTKHHKETYYLQMKKNKTDMNACVTGCGGYASTNKEDSRIFP